MNKKVRRNLTFADREFIERNCKEMSLSEIAKAIGRGKNTVVHEVRRNGGIEIYSAEKAQAEADARTRKRFEMYRSANINFEIISQAAALYKKGQTINYICEELNLSYAAVLRCLVEHFSFRNEKEYDKLTQRVDALEKKLNNLMKRGAT